jgi:hypothetical protein
MGIELRLLYSSRRRLHHHNAAGRPIDPTIYKPDPQIHGSPPLPPLRQPVESEGTGGLAGGETRETWLLLFASHGYCSEEKGRGKQSNIIGSIIF